MNISTLEDRLAANPKSPLFARAAWCCLEEGNLEKAIEISLRGLKQHPDYPTAHLVLGRCYQAAGRNVEALLEYRRVLKALPDNVHVQSLVSTIEEAEQEAFQKFAEERARQLREKRGTLSFEGFVTGNGSAAKPLPRRGDDEEDQRTRGEAGSTIATVTLAEIYASQAQYGEAIQVYERLRAERADHAEEYRKRIGELRALERSQQESALRETGDRTN